MTTETAPAISGAPRELPRYFTYPWQIFKRDRLSVLRKWADASGPDRIASLKIFKRNTVLINNPEMAGELLLARDDDFHKGPALSVYSRPLLGNGLLTSEEEFHRNQRKMVAPAFAHRRVTSYADSMAQASERLQERYSDGWTIDLSREMMRLTLGIVGKTLFDAEHTDDESDAVGRNLTTVMQYLTGILRSPIRPPSPYVPPWRRDVAKALADLDETIYGLIRERRASGRDAGDLLSMLLLARDENGELMDDRQIRDEAMTLFLAGHETTANALSWTWNLLATHPEIYRRMQAEVDSVLGGRTPTYEDLNALPYTLQVFKEAVRLYPPAYVIARQAQRETTIGGYRIPNRAVCFVSPYLMHRDPAIFPDPERFDPDRWEGPDAERRLPRHAYLPFGGGVRICIGASFSLIEGHIVLATLAQRITFERLDDATIQTEPLITLRPKGGIPMRVRRR